MPNLRIRPEDYVPNPFKQSMMLPAFRQQPVNEYLDEAPPVELPYPGNPEEAGNAGVTAKPVPPIVITQEEPVCSWRADLIALTSTTQTWLDDPAQGRLIHGRRGIIVVNHDTVLGVWIRHVGMGVTQGGFLHAGTSISLPLSTSCRVYAQSVALNANISFYQFGSFVGGD